MEHAIVAIFMPLAVFGGLAGVIATFGWARAERIRAMAYSAKHTEPSASQDAVLAELKALKQQIGDMQNTSHQFDLSFDESLTRLEQRVGHLEMKTAATTADTANVLRNGRHG